MYQLYSIHLTLPIILYNVHHLQIISYNLPRLIYKYFQFSCNLLHYYLVFTLITSDVKQVTSFTNKFVHFTSFTKDFVHFNSFNRFVFTIYLIYQQYQHLPHFIITAVLHILSLLPY